MWWHCFLLVWLKPNCFIQYFAGLFVRFSWYQVVFWKASCSDTLLQFEYSSHCVTALDMCLGMLVEDSLITHTETSNCFHWDFALLFLADPLPSSSHVFLVNQSLFRQTEHDAATAVLQSLKVLFKLKALPFFLHTYCLSLWPHFVYYGQLYLVWLQSITMLLRMGLVLMISRDNAAGFLPFAHYKSCAGRWNKNTQNCWFHKGKALYI